MASNPQLNPGWQVYAGSIAHSPDAASSASFLTLNNNMGQSFLMSANFSFGPTTFPYSVGNPEMDGFYGAGFVFDMYATGDSTYPYQFVAVYFKNVTFDYTNNVFTFYVELLISGGNRVGATGHASMAVSTLYSNQSTVGKLSVKRVGSYLSVFLNGQPVVFSNYYSTFGMQSYATLPSVPTGTYIFVNEQTNALITPTVGLFARYTNNSTPPTGTNADTVLFQNLYITDYTYNRSNEFDLGALAAAGGLQSITTPVTFSDTFTNLNNWQ